MVQLLHIGLEKPPGTDLCGNSNSPLMPENLFLRAAAASLLGPDWLPAGIVKPGTGLKCSHQTSHLPIALGALVVQLMEKCRSHGTEHRQFNPSLQEPGQPLLL